MYFAAVKLNQITLHYTALLFDQVVTPSRVEMEKEVENERAWRQKVDVRM